MYVFRFQHTNRLCNCMFNRLFKCSLIHNLFRTVVALFSFIGRAKLVLNRVQWNHSSYRRKKNINHAAVQRSNLLVFWKNWNWLAVRRSENHASALHLLWNQNDRNLCLSNGYHIRTNYSHTAGFLRSTNL